MTQMMQIMNNKKKGDHGSNGNNDKIKGIETMEKGITLIF